MPEILCLLIVDDDEDMLETLSDVFQEKGYRIETAKTGKEAITKARKRFFDVALIDIKLPDVTGIEVLQIFREKHPSMMTIIATGYATLQNAVDAVNLGANAYVMKPVDPERVDQMIRKFVARAMNEFVMSLEVPASLRKKIPRRFLEKVIRLKDPIKRIYVALYSYGKPATALEIAEPFGCARAYVSMRLNHLESMGLVKRSKAGHNVLFEVVL
jgi:ActR/RegA family two-component response regulator